MKFERLSCNDMIGKTFNWLTVIDSYFDQNKKTTFVICKCKCGKITKVIPAHLKNNKVKSCGCYRKIISKINTRKGCPLEKNANYIDGRSRHPLYVLWNGIKQRCYNPKHAAYKHYGGRGIKMCDEWLDFWKFVEWVEKSGEKKPKLTLDRINVNGNYEPNNCRWVPMSVQCVNKTDNILLTFNNETKTMSEWALCTGINYRTLNNRINRGWTVERALTEKVHTHNPRT